MVSIPPLAAASARVGWAVATSAVASPAARRGRMERVDLLLMVALERLLLLGVALLELLLLHHMGTCVVFLLSDALLLEVLHFRVVPLVHRSNLLSVLLFGVDLLLMVLRVRTFERIQLLAVPVLHGLELLGVLARELLLLFETLPFKRLNFLIVLT
jgi:hypothetical protein